MRTRRALLAAGALAPMLAITRWATDRTGPHDAVATDLGIPYGAAGGEDLLLDVYRPPQRHTPRPAVITIHGGAFVSGSRTDAGVVDAARHLTQAGYVVCSIDYRLVDPTALQLAWPAPLDDVQRAVRWVRAHALTYGIDPQRLGAYGVSAGAGLAAHLGLRETRDTSDPALAAYSSRVNCVVDVAGPTDGTLPWSDPSAIALGVAVFGGTFAEVPDVYRDASPLFHVDVAAAPFLIVHGTQDTIVPVAQARRLVAALHEVGVEVTYIEFPEAGHDVFAWERIGPLALDFLGRHLELER